LGSKQIGNSSKGIFEAPDAAAELKGTAYRSGITLICAFASRSSTLVHHGSMNSKSKYCLLRLFGGPTARKRIHAKASGQPRDLNLDTVSIR
jgi:hypothetical protein